MMQNAQSSVSDRRRILVVRTDRLGDVILTLPMLPLLRAWFPGAYLAMLVSRYPGEIVQGNPHLDEILLYDRDGSQIPFVELLRALRLRAFDTAFVVHPTPRLAWLVYCAGIRYRVGTGYRPYSFLFNRRVYDHRKDARYHELEYNLRLLRGVKPDFTGSGVIPRFDIQVDSGARERVTAMIGTGGERQLVVVHPGSGGSARDWPPERFGQLAARLAALPGIMVCVTGGPAEAALANQVAAIAGAGTIVFPGTLTLQELTALLESSTLLVGNSSGPLHLAVALGTPVVGLYPQHTAMSAGRWGPYTDKKRVLEPEKPPDCEDCAGDQSTACTCMASISVDEVFRACKDLLRSGVRKDVVHG
jgi:ADP-heptose:LPS heptosyltransferase